MQTVELVNRPSVVNEQPIHMQTINAVVSAIQPSMPMSSVKINNRKTNYLIFYYGIPPLLRDIDGIIKLKILVKKINLAINSKKNIESYMMQETKTVNRE